MWTVEPRELGFPAVLRSRRAIVIVATSMVFSLAVSIALASEVGPNDFRISQMGPDGITGFSGISPAVAYNSQDDRFLVARDAHVGHHVVVSPQATPADGAGA